MIPIIYYAHNMLYYDTPREAEELQHLQEYFYNGLIYNPNRPNIQYSKNPMVACLDIVQDTAITGVAFSHDLLRIPQGVYSEIKFAKKLRKPLYIIHRTEIKPYYGIIKLSGKDKKRDWGRV